MNPLPVVMIPGLGCDEKLFEQQVAALKERGHEVMVIDNTKHGTNKGLVAHVLKTAPPKFHLIGLSMGGYAAFEIMKQAPDRVDKLILLDTSPSPDPESKKADRIKSREALAGGNFAEETEKFWPSMVAKARVEDQALRRVYLDMAKRVGAQGLVNQIDQVISRDDFRPTLPHIKSPTLVIVGDDDQRFPVAVAQEIVDGINAGGGGKAQLKVIANAGHLSSLEQPESVTEAITSFLARDISRGRGHARR